MSLTVSGLGKTYYNIYALTNSDAYKANAVDSSAVSKSKYNVEDVSTALDMLSSRSNASAVGSVAGYARDLYKLSQIKSTASSDALSRSVLSLLSADTDMYNLIDTSGANAEKAKAAVAGSSATAGAISSYSGMAEAYKQYLSQNNQSMISLLL